MPQVSKKVRDALKTILSDATYGLNVNLAAAAAAYGVTAFQVDWSSDSQNFLFGRVPADLLEESTPIRYPLTTIDTLRSQHDPKYKYTVFGGRITGLIEIHQTWEPSGALPDFATWVDYIEDAVYQTLNRQANVWGSNLIYNFDVGVQKGPILAAGENWRQTLSCPCTFVDLVSG